ncbi:MAG: type II toxin-antitoxin system VapC family toxin [Saprospiraceae bacterium]
MTVLMDTHILIWYMENNARLKEQYIEVINDVNNQIYFSAVSIAEMAIKASKNKLKYPENIMDICLEIGFSELELKSKHSFLLRYLPTFHHDPFDRLLIVQAQSEKLKLMTEDQIFFQYDVELVV